MKPKAYTAWLIERTDLGYPLYWAGPSRSSEFTDNIDGAIKFRFQEDADAVAKRLNDTQPISFPIESREHQWGFTDELEEGE